MGPDVGKIEALLEVEVICRRWKGGPGSGNFGHEGRPGRVGGSGEGGRSRGNSGGNKPEHGGGTGSTRIDKVVGMLGHSLHIRGGDESSSAVVGHLNDLAKVDPVILEELKNKGFVWYVGNVGVTGLDDRQDLAGKIPRGWEQTGYTWDDVCGCGPNMYDSSDFKICAGVGKGGSLDEPVILHETAHAIDKMYSVSFQGGFTQLRAEAIKNGYVNSPYFRQEGEAGMQETWASLFAMSYQNRGEAERQFGKDLVSFALNRKTWMGGKL